MMFQVAVPQASSGSACECSDLVCLWIACCMKHTSWTACRYNCHGGLWHVFCSVNFGHGSLSRHAVDRTRMQNTDSVAIGCFVLVLQSKLLLLGNIPTMAWHAC